MSTKDESEMLANLDLLLNMDIVESQADWELLKDSSEMPDSDDEIPSEEE